MGLPAVRFSKGEHPPTFLSETAISPYEAEAEAEAEAAVAAAVAAACKAQLPYVTLHAR